MKPAMTKNAKTALHCFIVWFISMLGLIASAITWFIDPSLAYTIAMTSLISGYMSIVPIFVFGMNEGIKALRNQ